MTAAGTGTCDGCDREGPVQQLEEVILPSGPMVVCPECRYHAEELAERSNADCEGCSETVTAATLVRTELPDGTEMVLCADCREAVDAGAAPSGARQNGTGQHGPTSSDAAADTGASGGAASNGTTASAGATADAGTATDDATGSDARATANTGSSAAGDAASTASDGSGAQATSSSAGGSSRGEAVTDGATGKPATTQNTCDQCGGLFSIELYQVITVDGRTEQFCPDCKDDGLEEGIVRDVELRRAQAYEVLGLEGSASGDDVRQAYLQQVKEVHPDRADGDRSEFMLVQQAYERLRDD